MLLQGECRTTYSRHYLRGTTPARTTHITVKVLPTSHRARPPTPAPLSPLWRDHPSTSPRTRVTPHRRAEYKSTVRSIDVSLCLCFFLVLVGLLFVSVLKDRVS